MQTSQVQDTPHEWDRVGKGVAADWLEGHLACSLPVVALSDDPAHVRLAAVLNVVLGYTAGERQSCRPAGAGTRTRPVSRAQPGRRAASAASWALVAMPSFLNTLDR